MISTLGIRLVTFKLSYYSIYFIDSFLVEDTETFNEVLEGTFLLGFGDGLDVAQEFVEVAGLGVHFFLLWVAQNTGDILVGWLETKTTDEVTNLIIIF